MDKQEILNLDEASMLSFAEKLGSQLNGGEVIELIGDLGSGKTTFTKGLMLGVGYKANVSSPSFTISNVYKLPNMSVYHFDFYRLNDPGIIRNELAEVLEDKNAVVVTEWSEIIKDTLPSNKVTIKITSTPEDNRNLKITYPTIYKDLFN